MAAKHRADLDGLRGLAIALVVVFHLFVGRVSGGVDVFLLLAGFFFLGSQVRYADRPGALANPLWPLARTLRRLVPALVAVLAGSALILAVFAREWMSEPLARQLRAALTYVLNRELIAQGEAYAAADTGAGPLQHLWSMSVQGQFYAMAIAAGSLCVVWPFFRRRLIGPLLVAATVASFAWAARNGLHGGEGDYYSTWARLWQMTLGGALAVYSHRVRLPRPLAGAGALAGVGMLCATGFVIGDTSAFPGPLSLLPVGGAILVILAGGAGPAGVMLRSRPLQWLGRIAYPLYLWHWPLVILISHATGNWDVPAWLGLAVLGLSVALADATHRFIEEPLREHGPRRTADLAPAPPPVPATAATAILVAAGFFTVTAWNGYLASIDRREPDPALYPGALAVRGEPVADADPFPDLAWHIGPRSWREGCMVEMSDPGDVHLECTFGDAEADRTVVLAGHSHVDTLVEPLHDLGVEHGFRVVTMLREACPVTTRTSRLVGPECVDWSRTVIDRLIETEPDMVVSVTTTSRGWPGEAEWVVPGSDGFWGELAEQGIPFLGLRDNPRLMRGDGTALHPHRCLPYAEDPMDCAVPRGRAYAEVNPADEILRRWPTARSVDTADWFCPDGLCPPIIGNIYVYRDNDHVTNAYSRSLAPLIWRHLGPHLERTGATARQPG